MSNELNLKIDVDNTVRLNLQDVVGKRIAVLGISGQGKTNTNVVLVEEFLRGGLPVAVIDVEGEYWGLKEKFQILVAGSGQHADLHIGADQAGALAHLSLEERLPVVLDVSEFDQDEQQAFLLAYFTELWQVASRLRKPYQIVVEEAHEFIPEGMAKTPLAKLLTRIALRGRKRGLGAIVTSQRSANVSKNFLTQAEILFLHKVVHEADTKTYRGLIPGAAKEVDDLVHGLEIGQAIYLKNYAAQKVTVRRRDTFDAGATPQFAEQVAAHLVAIDTSALAAKLAALAPAAPTTEPVKKTAAATSSKSELEELNRLREENSQLKKELANLKKQLEAALTKLEAAVNKNKEEKKLPPVKAPAPVTVVETNLNKYLPTPAQQARYTRLVGRLKSLPTFQKKVLALLQERTELKPLSVDEIGIALGRKGGDGKMLPILIRAKLVIGEKRITGPTLYKSNLEKLVGQEFPGVQPGPIISELEKLLKV